MDKGQDAINSQISFNIIYIMRTKVLKDLSAANVASPQPSNRRLTESLKLRVLKLIRENYSDFGPTLAAEKLRERHDIRLSIETVRNWMTSDGLWVPHARRKSRVYQPRHRRDCLGELIQIDGSHHDWFEGRIHDSSRSGIFLNERCKPAQDPSGRYRPPSYHTSCCNPTRLKISDRHC